MSVNKNLSNYLRAKGIAQSELAKTLGVTQQSLNRLLNSDDIKVSQLIEITKALELPVTYFFDGKEHVSNEETEEYKRRIEELERLNDGYEDFKIERTIEALSDIRGVIVINESEKTKQAFHEYCSTEMFLKDSGKKGWLHTIIKMVALDVTEHSKENLRFFFEKKLQEFKNTQNKKP